MSGTVLNRRAFLSSLIAAPLLLKAKPVSQLPGDYPDFLRVAQQQGQPIYNPGAITTAATVVSPLFYVGPWQALALKVVFGGAAGQWGGFTAQWYADPGATILLNVVSATGQTGSTYEEVITNRGAWVRFTSAYVSGIGSSIITPIVTPLATYKSPRDNQEQLDYLTPGAVAYAANQARTVCLTNFSPGPALLSIFGTATFGIQMVDLAGPGVLQGMSYDGVVSASPWAFNVEVNLSRYQPSILVTNGPGAQNIQAGVVGLI